VPQLIRNHEVASSILATSTKDPMAAKILVVDDDESIRELLRLHLSGAGYDVDVAPDAISAGYMVLRSRPDLIITDVSMPHMDGFEFIAALKGDKSIPDIPVVFLTSVEDGDHRGKELGAVGYVTKPVRADRLLSLVAAHVPGGAHPIG
jgi:two-component system chemotaxis response regulator CheY